MLFDFFAVEPELALRARTPAIGKLERPIQGLELAMLFAMGVGAAAAAQFIEWKLKTPGHAIVRTIVPLAIGLAIVPRKGAALSMGGVAAGSVLAFQGSQLGTAGLGALTSLLLCGLALELVGTRATSGWRLYVGFGLAGLAVNLAAFAVQFGAKWMNLGGAGGGSLEKWLPRAAITYPLCGILAGLLCATILFRFKAGENRDQP